MQLTKTPRPHNKFYDELAKIQNGWFDIKDVETISMFALDYETIYELVKFMGKNKFNSILDMGLGTSSIILSKYAKAESAAHTVTEHN